MPSLYAGDSRTPVARATICSTGTPSRTNGSSAVAISASNFSCPPAILDNGRTQIGSSLFLPPSLPAMPCNRGRTGNSGWPPRRQNAALASSRVRASSRCAALFHRLDGIAIGGEWRISSLSFKRRRTGLPPSESVLICIRLGCAKVGLAQSLRVSAGDQQFFSSPLLTSIRRKFSSPFPVVGVPLGLGSATEAIPPSFFPAVHAG